MLGDFSKSVYYGHRLTPTAPRDPAGSSCTGCHRQEPTMRVSGLAATIGGAWASCYPQPISLYREGAMRSRILVLAGGATTAFIVGATVFAFLRPGDIGCSMAVGVNMAAITISVAWFSLW
jgi:hypothetical protein